MLADLATEKALLAALAAESSTDPRSAQALVEQARLVPEDFSNPAIGAVYEACGALLREGATPDPLAVENRLKANYDAIEANGGKEFIDELLGSQLDISAGAFGEYVKVVKDRSLRRKIAKTLKNAYADILRPDCDPTLVLGETTGSLAGLTRDLRSFRPMTSFLEDVKADIEAKEAGEVKSYITTGIPALDRAIGGLQRGIVTVVGADTGVGKSSFFASVAHDIALRGVRVGVFSLEDEGVWLVWRHLAHDSGLDQFQLRFGTPPQGYKTTVDNAFNKIQGFAPNVLIDDRAGLKPEQIAATARDMVVNYGCQVIIVDHMGEVDLGRGEERHDLKIAHAFGLLRDLAKQHHIAMVVATQVTMSKDRPVGAIPNMRDFRNSKEIGNKCRVALGLGRRPGGDTMKIGVLKQTSGPAGEVIEVPFVGSAAMVATVATTSTKRSRKDEGRSEGDQECDIHPDQTF